MCAAGTGQRSAKEVYVRSSDADVLSAARSAGFLVLSGPQGTPPEDAALLLDAHGTLSSPQGAALGRHVRIADARDATAAAAMASDGHQLVLIEPAPDCWNVIPAENLVAAFASSPTRLLLQARSADDARLFLGALETGADGVVLDTDNAGDVESLHAHLQRVKLPPSVTLADACVTRVQPVGLGDRACVDTAALLQPGEGLLLGCFAGGYFLVLSEALETDYIASRPFRVNAGAVCNYALQGERTAYLSELSAGATVLLTDAAGVAREEVVGRIKIERRPLLLLEAETVAGTRFSVLLQNAETVRVATPSGSASVAELRVGDAVLLALNGQAARHAGIAVDETCCER